MSEPRDPEDCYESAACGLLRLRIDGTIVRINRTMCRWLGRPADELLAGVSFQNLLTIGSKLFHQTHWMPLLQLQGSVSEVQVDLVHPGGTALPALVNAVLYTSTPRDEAPQEGFIEVAVFIATDRRKYEGELLQARRHAELLLAREREAQRALHTAQRALEQNAEQRAQLAEQLIGIVSHDLRTPLSTVLLGAHVLRSNQLVAAQERAVTRIASAAERATRLVNDLLDFTQARLAGGLRVQRREIELHQVVCECVDELRLAWPGRMIDCRAEGEGLGLADPDRVAQLVTNLTNNALTYGMPQVPVSITSVVRDDALELRVHNSGTPIDPELLPHLFEPMRRGEQSVSLGSRSVGLGLYIVHEIAAAHGGSVNVSSNEQAGTTFVVSLPRC
jgi:sigma-B regulation protein RsbU (phosphoserine phosphatase)